MKIKVNDATNLQLDWMVATCEGFISEAEWEGTEVWMEHPDGRCGYSGNFNYTTNWSLSGPIIEREKIRLDCAWNPGPWCGACKIDGVTAWTEGPTPLIAAMRCYVASRLGDEVEVPEEST